ncbi:hypothetical protein SERLADRAFT_474561 [Serpula lacrymans var. lacrymans S7.9]|nr:uncharacterized protein SERLADRAFT_474561 [Serpula lacrymans var. lacrymans S7.9]EGO21737.1 hypothetical protein SERLADRAFT_474561 [Serpula lacrymans var. lacrymans S7.9]
MSSMSQADSYCWRRLYTDACILRSLANLLDTTSVNESVASESIAKLDRAIIIAGAPGIGRLELIHNIIQQIQSQYLASHNPFQLNPSNKRFSSISSIDKFISGTFKGNVPYINPPSLTLFQRLWCNRPFILRGHILHWPALSEHPWSSIDYLRTIAGPGRVVPVEIGQDYRLDDWKPDIISWDSFLSSLYSSSRPGCQESHDVLYLAQHNLMMQFPALRDDIVLPDYIFASLPPPSTYLEYQPPKNDDQLVLNAWLGPQDTVSPAHTDPYFNCYAQVVGRKTVWLAPPDMTPFMYPFTVTSSDIADRSHNPAANIVNPSLSNTSRVDVFPCSAEAESASRGEFPAFWETTPKYALCATLEPGDMLFFPPGWWHAMRSEDVSFSVSMWF